MRRGTDPSAVLAQRVKPGSQPRGRTNDVPPVIDHVVARLVVERRNRKNSKQMCADATAPVRGVTASQVQSVVAVTDPSLGRTEV